MFCEPIKKVYVRTTNNSFMKGIDSMRKRNIIAAILMIAMTTSLFTGCKPSVPDDGTNTTEQGNTSATTEATTTEIQKAPVTLYANFDNEVLNDAPTTLPDDGFYYKAFTSVALDKINMDFWATVMNPYNFYGDLKGTIMVPVGITDTDSFIEYFKKYYKDDYIASRYNGQNLVLANEDYENMKKKIDINTWYSFCQEFLGETLPKEQGNNDAYDYEKIDAEVKPQILAIADAWLEANFMGIPIPEEMTTEDFKTYINTDAAYSYFASKGILPYKISNEGWNKASYEALNVTDTRELFDSDMTSIWSDYSYVNFVMTCTSEIYLETETGEQGSYPIHFIIVIKPEKNADGSWIFKLDYASFSEFTKQMDKFGGINNRNAAFDIIKRA